MIVYCLHIHFFIILAKIYKNYLSNYKNGVSFLHILSGSFDHSSYLWTVKVYIAVGS